MSEENEMVRTLIKEAVEEWDGIAVVNWDDLGMDIDNLSRTAEGRLTESTLESIGENVAPKIIRWLRECIEEGGENGRKVKEALGIDENES